MQTEPAALPNKKERGFSVEFYSFPSPLVAFITQVSPFTWECPSAD